MTSKYLRHDAVLETRADGTMLLRSQADLGPVAAKTTDWLDHWAGATPDAVFLAERSGAGWREVTYAAARDTAWAIAAGLLDLGMGPDAPILVISGNSVDHGLLALAAQYIGAPIVPLAEQYAMIPDARVQIDFVASVVNPRAVYAEDGDALGDVLTRDALAGMHRIVSRGGPGGAHSLDALSKVAGDITPAVQRVGPDTIAKILMTSGSTSSPKGVPTSHAMMCANQAQLAQGLPFSKSPPTRHRRLAAVEPCVWRVA